MQSLCQFYITIRTSMTFFFQNKRFDKWEFLVEHRYYCCQTVRLIICCYNKKLLFFRKIKQFLSRVNQMLNTELNSRRTVCRSNVHLVGLIIGLGGPLLVDSSGYSIPCIMKCSSCPSPTFSVSGTYLFQLELELIMYYS